MESVYSDMIKTEQQIREYKRNWNRKKLGITTESYKKSATYKGRKSELLALKILHNSVDNNLEVMNRNYDVLWNGQTIDVKSCELYKRKIKNQKRVKNCSGWWVFNKNKGNSDLYFCICLIKNRPIRYYLIPAIEFGKGITIGQKSYYNKFIFNV